ncbi:uncharacterized protein LOC121790073 [Salvia splendens]|uniref:uncharacterized protein LOC121790073 n=1 Tax=Salvia splendens TaxID=180675 RepID=UPI001C2791BF|nr:uncharacterized protein LOC121790073 [Salvia splendens]
MTTNQRDFSKSAASGKRSKNREDRPQQLTAASIEIRSKNREGGPRKQVTTTSPEMRSKNKHDRLQKQKPQTSKRGRSQTNDEEEHPVRKRQRHAKGKRTMVSVEQFKIRRPKLVVKIGVKVIVDAIEKLNSKQIAALEEMGFGQLVHLKIRSIPAKMTFSLLENFNQDNCSRIKLIDDQPLHITEEDVHAT